MRVLVSCCVQPSQTKDEYSSIGSTYEMFIWFKAILLRLYFNFLVTPIILAALLTIFFSSLCHCPLALNVTPKCLWKSTNLNWTFSKTKLGKPSNCLNVSKIASVLRRLNLMSHCLAQAAISSKSWFINPSISTIEDAELNKELSSAKRRVKLKRESAMSLM